MSIVTPALNAAPYIRKTLESVRAQSYPNVEQIVTDGGSTDATEQIVRAFSPDARFSQQPDSGQAAAMNRGVRETSGEFLMFLNADDVLLHSAAKRLVTEMLAAPATCAVVYGDAWRISSDDTPLDRYPTLSFDPERFRRNCFIAQPAALVRRSAFEAIGGFDERLQSALDYDFWIRLAKRYAFRYLHADIALVRMHAESKTLAQKDSVYREVIATLRKHYGYVPYEWAYGYASYLLDRSDQYFHPPLPSRTAVALSLLIGSALNLTKVVPYCIDWLGHRRIGAFLGRR